MRVVAAACVWAALWVGVRLQWVGSANGVEEELWRRVQVEQSWFKSYVEKTTLELSSLMQCGVACMRHDWCRLWCHTPPTKCLLTSLIVSGSYRPSDPLTARTCYTNREPEMVFGANITSSPEYDAQRVRENLVDGVFAGLVRNCATVKPDNDTKSWFLVDFGTERLVSRVVLIAQPNDAAVSRFPGLEVRVGNEEQAGNFTSYTLLGVFMDPVVGGEVVVLQPSAPLLGRYVSIQKTNNDMLQIAHLEIF